MMAANGDSAVPAAFVGGLGTLLASLREAGVNLLRHPDVRFGGEVLNRFDAPQTFAAQWCDVGLELIVPKD